MESLSVSALFREALSAVSSAFGLPTAEKQTQDLLSTAQSLLHETKSRVSSLSLFSPNESFEDISTRNLAFLFLPFVSAEVVGRLVTNGRQDRINRLLESQRLYQSFNDSLELYEIVPDEDKSLHTKRTSSIPDPAKRRELKIKQYKKEKEIQNKIDAIQRRHTGNTAQPLNSNNFDLISTILSSFKVENDDGDDDDDLRDITILLLGLLYAQSHSQLQMLQQERDLLQNAPPSPPQSPPRELDNSQSDDWRLDVPTPQGGPDGRGPLLDASGKPMRPFTILPAGSAANRAQLQGQVFRPDHRLPSMSVDEYLEIERQRGNVISGGGPESEERLTTSEQLAIDSELDGAAFGEQRAEEKRQKDESWARYTDSHPRGAGNTMNRG